MTDVRLDELDRSGAVLRAGVHTAHALSQSNLVEVRPEDEHTWRVLPCGRVGAVRIGDVQVQVVPKERVGLSRLLFLLGYADNPGFRPEDVEATAEPDLWPALAESLARLTDRALERGVLQGYRSHDDALRTVRGRIRVSDQVARRPGFLIPLEVSYDEYTVDTAENRILRSALRRMQGVPRLNTDVRRRLAHLDGKLTGADLCAPGAPLPRWQPTRLNQRYQPALRLAELVLRHASAEAGPGGLQVAAFVVEMWKVFEDFVGTALREALYRRPGRTDLQYRDHLDVPAVGQPRGDVAMAVDIVHLDPRDRPQLIFDAKYKVAADGGRYPNADHYQMLAYCTALDVPEAWLVYAQGSAGVVERQVRNSHVRIIEYPLDLGADPRALLGQVADLAGRAWSRSEHRGIRLLAV